MAARFAYRLAPLGLGIALASLLGCRSAPPWLEQGRFVVRVPEVPRKGAASVLYLEPERAPRWYRRPARIDVDSDGSSFRPSLTAVHVGDEVRFVNGGPVAHRIFRAEGEGRRERLVGARSRSAALRIPKVGENRFYCSLHPDETFVVFASPSPYFVVIDGGRSHRIDRIPTGVYRLSSWTEAGVQALGAVEIRSDAPTSYRLHWIPAPMADP